LCRVILARRQRQGLSHPGATYVDVTAHLPEAPQTRGQLHGVFRITGGERPVQRGPKIVRLHLEAVEPFFALAAEHMWLRLLRQRDECLHMPVLDGRPFVTLLQLLRRELSDRLQHQEAWLTEVRKPSEKALVSQLVERVDHVAADISRRAADRLDLFETPAAGENGEAGEQPPAGLLDHVVAPLDRAAKRLLTARKVASPAAEGTERLLQSSQQRLRRKQFDAGRRQLDRQRQTVDPLTDAGDRRCVF